MVELEPRAVCGLSFAISRGPPPRVKLFSYMPSYFRSAHVSLLGVGDLVTPLCSGDLGCCHPSLRPWNHRRCEIEGIASPLSGCIPRSLVGPFSDRGPGKGPRFPFYEPLALVLAVCKAAV